MIWNIAIEPQSTKPAIGQIGIGRGPPDVAIVRPQVRTNLGQVDEPVDLTQQMIVGKAPLQTEAVKQRLPLTRRSPIIDRISRTQQNGISHPRLNQAEFFKAIRP